MQLSIKHLTFNAKKIIIIIKKQISVVELITMQKEIKKKTIVAKVFDANMRTEKSTSQSI